MSENAVVEEKTTVISLHEERPPISNEEAVSRITEIQATLSETNQRLGIDEKAAVEKLREELRSARKK